MKRLFISDLDGTLLNNDAVLSEETIRKVNQCIEAGMDFTISTARSPATFFGIVEGLNLKLPISLLNGVLIYDMQSKQYIKIEEMSRDVIMILLGIIKLNGLQCFLYGMEDNTLNVYYDSVASSAMNKFRNESIMRYDKKYTEVEDLTLVADKHIVYLMLREKKEKLEILRQELTIIKGIKSEFYKDIYHSDFYYLEIYNENASKGSALEYIKKQGEYDTVVSFGDNLNDRAMCEASDYFYAVGNAHPQIQNIATGIIPSNEENGVARFLENIMYTI